MEISKDKHNALLRELLYLEGRIRLASNQEALYRRGERVQAEFDSSPWKLDAKTGELVRKGESDLRHTRASEGWPG